MPQRALAIGVSFHFLSLQSPAEDKMKYTLIPVTEITDLNGIDKLDFDSHRSLHTNEGGKKIYGVNGTQSKIMEKHTQTRDIVVVVVGIACRSKAHGNNKSIHLSHSFYCDKYKVIHTFSAGNLSFCFHFHHLFVCLHVLATLFFPPSLSGGAGSDRADIPTMCAYLRCKCIFQKNVGNWVPSFGWNVSNARACPLFCYTKNYFPFRWFCAGFATIVCAFPIWIVPCSALVDSIKLQLWINAYKNDARAWLEAFE